MATNDRNYWTSLEHNGSWYVTQEGTLDLCGNWKTQDEAWKECKRLARLSKGEALLTGQDGLIRLRETYGHDPVGSPG